MILFEICLAVILNIQVQRLYCCIKLITVNFFIYFKISLITEKHHNIPFYYIVSKKTKSNTFF